MATKLILIRHGVTDWNLKRRYCGFADLGLSDKGKKEAKKLQKRLKEEDIGGVYCSDRKRAIQSAKIIFKGKKIKKMPDLREIHFGIFEGLTHEEVLKKYPGVYKRWLSNPFAVTIPYGENMNNFKKRVQKAFRKIIRLNQNRTAAIVCHGGVISIFINSILKSRNFWKQIPCSGSLSIIEYKNGRAKIKLLNDVSHLKGLRDSPLKIR